MTTTNVQTIAEQLLLGRYRVLEVRGQGGFGTVSVCWDPRLMRRVAIKSIELSPQGGRKGGRRGVPDQGDPRSNPMLRAALDETRTAGMLSQPSIVQVMDFGYDDSTAYIIMEYVEGASLAELLDATEDHLLTLDEAAAVAEGVCDALQFAHENGVLHLDIKPDNIMIDMSGRVRLADFGMAALSSATGYSGVRGGTVGYMPPEQSAGSDVDVRTDVFAFACVLYEALTGLRPFSAPTPEESCRLVEAGAPDPCALSESVPVRVADALLDALEADPDRRTGSVEVFAASIQPSLGRAKAGRKSLSALVADVLDDSNPASAQDEPADMAPSGPGGQPGWNPDGGAVGEAAPKVANVALRACGSLLPAVVVAAALSALASTSATALAVSGFVAVALMGLFAPQLSSILAPLSAGIAAIAAGHYVLGGLSLAAGVAWWLVAGRREPLRCCCAFASCAVPGMPPLSAQLGGLLLDAPQAAATAVAAALVAACLSAAAGNPPGPSLAVEALGWALAAAASGALCSGGSKLRCYIGCIASAVVLCMAKIACFGMENGGVTALLPAETLAGATGSTILVILLVFALGSPAALLERPES